MPFDNQYTKADSFLLKLHASLVQGGLNDYERHLCLIVKQH